MTDRRLPLGAMAVVLALGGCAVAPEPPADQLAGPPTSCESGYVQLTFDDGPTRDVTPAVLDVLAAKGATATFFVTGENVQENPDIVRRAHEEGHRLGNHSWDHPDLSTLGRDEVESQLRRTSEVIQEATGSAPTLWRPPYGASNDIVDQAAEQAGLTTMLLWDIAPGDADSKEPPSVETIRDRVLQEVQPDAVVLLHDAWTPNTPAAVALVLDGLAEQGYCTR
ncbi:polysaccharide deacetylase family protein [Geodermatophilus sp. URMC 61]|uniref:polysaccharide deacetylase family protein n=1 Tax=Geodermatophilus sp. URMC 61 TaxID=3423411 RepID=UPI00406C5C5F